MYAIFQAKGKQFRAEPEKTIRMPSLDAAPGDRVTFDEVLLAERDGDVLVGRPAIRGARVAAEVVRHGKGDKIVVYKMKRRKGYRRKQGHRQKFTEVRVVDIDLGEGEAAVERPESEVEEEVEEAEEAPEQAPAEPEAPAVAETPPEAEAGAEPEARAQAGAAGEAEAVVPEDVDITPAARKLAEEHEVDVTKIEGTGKEGRVLKADVQGAIDRREQEQDEE